MAELALRDGCLTPHGLPDGEVVLTCLFDGSGTQTGIRVDRADPRILISGELLDETARDPGPPAWLDTTGCAPPPYRATYAGAVLRIEGVNRTVVYRVTGYVPAIHAYIAEWPD